MVFSFFVTGTKRREENLVDPAALREAVIHNDFARKIPPVFEIFSDRIVTNSYGGLIPGQGMEDFFSCTSMPRNRELMRVFRDLGFAEQLGSGMSRILKAYDRSVFDISEHFIKVVFPFKESEEQLLHRRGDATGRSVLGALRKAPSLTAKQLSAVTSISERNSYKASESLKTGHNARV